MRDPVEPRETERVYRPAEDSGLLADAAIARIPADGTVLDVGTGSGFVARRVADATGARVIGSDVNPHACLTARERGVEVVRADLAEPFRAAAFDAVVFNPPYLPTPPEQERADWMERALSGGESGRAVIDRFLEGVGRVLAPDGIVLLVVSSLSGINAVRDRAGAEGFRTTAVAEDSFPFERLVVLELITGDHKAE